MEKRYHRNSYIGNGTSKSKQTSLAVKSRRESKRARKREKKKENFVALTSLLA